MYLNILAQLPLYLTWLAGIVLAIVTWRKHPQVSLFTLIGLVVVFLNAGFGLFFNMIMVPRLMEGGRSVTSISGVLTIVHAVQTLISAVGFGFVLAAIFGWRRA